MGHIIPLVQEMHLYDREYFSGRPINFKTLRAMFAARYFRYYKSLIKKFVTTLTDKWIFFKIFTIENIL